MFFSLGKATPKGAWGRNWSDLAVMARRVGTNGLVLDAQIGGRGFEQHRKVALRLGKAVREFEVVIRLDVLHLHTFSCKCCHRTALSRGTRMI